MVILISIWKYDKREIWCLQRFIHMVLFPLSVERSWISPGSLLGGHSHGGVLLHGSPMVCGCHCHLHCSHRQLEDGDRDFCTWRTTKVFRSEVYQRKMALPNKSCTHLCVSHEEMGRYGEWVMINLFLHLLF